MQLMSRAPAADFDAIVIGAGHNGLVTAAYLAKAGLRTLLLEARRDVGGTAASEEFAGATVNVCNCDHVTFRTTPVMSELDLASFGLQYLDIEPAQHHMAWCGGPPWTQYHDVERTLDSLRRTHPGEVDGYRRYLRAAVPAVKLILAAASEPPSIRTLSRRAVRHRLAAFRRSCVEPAQRGRRAAVVLPTRRARRHRGGERADGVGHQPRASAAAASAR